VAHFGGGETSAPPIVTETVTGVRYDGWWTRRGPVGAPLCRCGTGSTRGHKQRAHLTWSIAWRRAGL